MVFTWLVVGSLVVVCVVGYLINDLVNYARSLEDEL
jgi:hypothetical protein